MVELDFAGVRGILDRIASSSGPAHTAAPEQVNK